MKTFVISDLHFGHKNIIDYCHRPFSSVEEMDEQMILRWNSVVGDQDTVYFGGDFQFYKNDRYLFERLNGRYKYLVIGNHDHKLVKNMDWVHVDKRFEFLHHDVWVVLDHYPLYDWNKSTQGSIHLHGHTHDKVLPYVKNRFSMNAEHLNYTPCDLDDFMKRREV